MSEYSEYDGLMDELDKDTRIGANDFIVSEIRTFDWNGDTIYTISGTLLTSGNAKATLKWSEPPAPAVIKAEMAAWPSYKRKGVKKSINIGKQLAEFYGTKVPNLKAGDVLRVRTERVKFTNKKTGSTGQMTEIVALLPKGDIGQASKDAAKAVSDIPF